MSEYFKKQVHYSLTEVLQHFRGGYPHFGNIEEGFEFFDGQKRLLELSQLREEFQEFKMEYVKEGPLVRSENNRIRLERPDKKETLRELTKIQENQTQLQLNFETQDFIRTFCKNFRTKFLVYQDEEKQMLEAINDEERSRELFKTHIKKIRQFYYSAKKTRIDLDQKNLEQLEFIVDSKYQSHINTILKLVQDYQRIFLSLQNFVQKEKQYFILKLPLWMLIYYRLRILGVQPSFLDQIVYYIEENLSIDRFFEFKTRITFHEA